MSGWSGVVVVVAVLVGATGIGLFAKRRNGNFRAVAVIDSAGGPATSPPSAAVGQPTAVPGATSTAMSGAGSRAASGSAEDPMMGATLSSLGVTLDTPVTLLQFSSAFCAPCRTTRVLCADVATKIPGVRHVEVDAESHLDAVRTLEIWRTPTVLIVDDRGRVRRRASGAPTRAQLVAAVADVLPRTDLGTPAARG